MVGSEGKGNEKWILFGSQDARTLACASLEGPSKLWKKHCHFVVCMWWRMCSGWNRTSLDSAGCAAGFAAKRQQKPRTHSGGRGAVVSVEAKERECETLPQTLKLPKSSSDGERIDGRTGKPTEDKACANRVCVVLAASLNESNDEQNCILTKYSSQNFVKKPRNVVFYFECKASLKVYGCAYEVAVAPYQPQRLQLRIQSQEAQPWIAVFWTFDLVRKQKRNKKVLLVHKLIFAFETPWLPKVRSWCRLGSNSQTSGCFRREIYPANV